MSEGILTEGNDPAPAQTPAPEQKPSDAPVEKPTEQASQPPSEPPAEKPEDKKEGEKVVPETYADFKTPEGFGELDKEHLDTFLPLAKEAGLTQDNAQKFVDLHAQAVTKITKAVEERNVKAWNDLQDTWRADAKIDKEIGGAHHEQATGLAKKGLEAVATPEFRKFLDDYGFSSHPEMIRAFKRVGEAVAEDKMHFGGAGAGGDTRTVAERLYPSMAKKP